MPASLYGAILSPNVARVAVVAKTLGIPLTSKHVDLASGEHKKEPYTNLNPFGQIPAYVSEDGTLTLFESRAIARYLDLSTGGKLLHIHDHATYGKIENWASVESGTFAPKVQTIFFEVVVKPLFRKQPTDQAVVDAGKVELNKVLDVYEKHFVTTKTTFLVSNEVTFADLCHVPGLAPIFQNFLPDILNGHPHVKAWFERLVALPQWVEVVKEQQAIIAAITKS